MVQTKKDRIKVCFCYAVARQLLYWWVPHSCRALKVVCNKYGLIHEHMHETAVDANHATIQGRARNLVATLESYKHVAFMFFLLDILNVLQKLSLTFQMDEVLLVISKITRYTCSKVWAVSQWQCVWNCHFEQALEWGQRADQYEEQGCSCHKSVSGLQVWQFVSATLLQQGFWKLDIGRMAMSNCLSLVKKKSMFLTTSSSCLTLTKRKHCQND